MTLSTEAGRAVVHVVDDGPALDPSVRATLFDPLRTTKSHGLGLGLPIARALARAMHGELSLDPAAAKSFRLELPLSRAADELAARRSCSSKTSSTPASSWAARLHALATRRSWPEMRPRR